MKTLLCRPAKSRAQEIRFPEQTGLQRPESASEHRVTVHIPLGLLQQRLEPARQMNHCCTQCGRRIITRGPRTEVLLQKAAAKLEVYAADN